MKKVAGVFFNNGTFEADLNFRDNGTTIPPSEEYWILTKDELFKLQAIQEREAPTITNDEIEKAAFDRHNGDDCAWNAFQSGAQWCMDRIKEKK